MRLTFTVLLFLIGTVSLLPYYKKGKKGYFPHVGRAAVAQDNNAGGEAAPDDAKEAPAGGEEPVDEEAEAGAGAGGAENADAGGELVSDVADSESGTKMANSVIAKLKELNLWLKGVVTY